MLIGNRNGRTSYHFTLLVDNECAGFEDHVFFAPLEAKHISQILDLAKRAAEEEDDPETAHMIMDGLLVALANDAGHQNVVEAFYNTPRWYA
jgi:hypothetical protein